MHGKAAGELSHEGNGVIAGEIPASFAIRLACWSLFLGTTLPGISGHLKTGVSG